MIFLPSAWKAKVYCISSSWGHLLFLASLFFLVLFFQFPKYVPVSDGGWHHVAVTWSGVNGTLTPISDGLIRDKREAYAVEWEPPSPTTDTSPWDPPTPTSRDPASTEN